MRAKPGVTTRGNLESTRRELVRPAVEKQRTEGELRGVSQEEDSEDDGIFKEIFDEREEINEEERKNEGRKEGDEDDDLSGSNGNGLSQDKATVG